MKFLFNIVFPQFVLVYKFVQYSILDWCGCAEKIPQYRLQEFVPQKHVVSNIELLLSKCSLSIYLHVQLVMDCVPKIGFLVLVIASFGFLLSSQGFVALSHLLSSIFI